jgi:preprotein translocase subunit SecD
MTSNLQWKMAFIGGVVLLCIFGLIGLPQFPPRSWTDIKDNFSKRVKRGLDLQGGTHMILQVQVNEALNLHTEQTLNNLTRQMREKNIHYEEARRENDTHILVRNVAAEQIADFRDLVTGGFQEWDIAPAAGEINGFVLSMKPSYAAILRDTTLTQAVETIRRRIDALGLTEPLVAAQGRGENEILVQLPGEGDPTRAKAVIQAGGQLELRLVREGGPWASETEALGSFGGVLPAGTELVRGRSEARNGSQGGSESWYLLDRLPVVTGRDLRSATPAPDGTIPGRYKVNFSISTEAARRFGPFTEANLGKQLAIVLDHRVYSAPNIRGRIDDSGQIEGSFTQDAARDLALVLRSGALPASIKYLEERTVGPSLGADSVRQGFLASIVSLVAVMVFMLFYYRLSGVNAAVALIFNLIILLAALAYFGAVLTLPGIAGVILTVGMGVDSNVLVFERIREELRAGKAKSGAVEAGFDRAFLTIIDTHVTTVVSCVFLFLFGTGPVQGFAVTLVIGLIANLFTSIYVSKAIFHWHLARQPREEALSI